MKDEIAQLVAQEGNTAEAEERIVCILAQRYPPQCSLIREHAPWQCEPTEEQYINTEYWRRRIRKEQGRKKHE